MVTTFDLASLHFEDVRPKGGGDLLDATGRRVGGDHRRTARIAGTLVDGKRNRGVHCRRGLGRRDVGFSVTIDVSQIPAIRVEIVRQTEERVFRSHPPGHVVEHMGAVGPRLLHIDLMRDLSFNTIDENWLDAKRTKGTFGDRTGGAAIRVEHHSHARCIGEVGLGEKTDVVVDGAFAGDVVRHRPEGRTPGVRVEGIRGTDQVPHLRR